MGGEGSGNFRPRRTTVEECLGLSASALLGLGTIGEEALDSTVGWEGDRYGGCSVRVSWDPARALRLSYSVRGEHRQQEIDWSRLGGRLYFDCPECRRRCDRLYLPDDGRRFLCRSCHGLTYESARTSRKPPKSFLSLLRESGEDDPDFARRLWRA